MKPAAYILGVTGLFISVLALASVIFHTGPTSLIMSFGALFIEIIVLPVIAINVARSNSKNRASNILGILSVFTLIAGLYFKLQHWPGSFAIALLGIILFFIAAILVANGLYRRDISGGNI